MSSNTGTSPFDDFNKNFQFEDDGDYIAPLDKPKVDEAALGHLKGIVNSSTAPAQIDTTSTSAAPASATSELAEYFKDFEEVSKQKYLNPSEDRTDYSAEAIRKFGSDYSHFNTRDQIYDQTLYNQQYREAISANPNYQVYDDIAQGRGDINSVIGNVIADKLRQNLDYTQERYEEKLAIYIQDGQLTQEGRKLAEDLKQNATQLKRQIEDTAKATANQKVSEYSTYRTVIDEQVKTYKPFGIDLPEELRTHLKEIIASGKSKQVPTSPEQRAQREMLEALVSDPKAAYEFIRLIDARGVEHGIQKAAKTNFRNN